MSGQTPEQKRIAELEAALAPFARYVRDLQHLPALIGTHARLEPEDWRRAVEAMRDREE